MDRRTTWLLPAAVMLGPFIVLLDTSIVNVALPTIQDDLDASVTGVQWVVDAYNVALTAFVLSSGTLGDRYGRRRAFLLGIAIFTLGSIGCAAANNIAMLVGSRLVQGVGGALVMTGAPSLIAQAYPDPAQRAKMMGYFSMLGGSSVVMGPVLGGVLVDATNWRWIFVINVPIGIATIWCGLRAIPESSHPEHAAVDPFGQVIGVLLLGSLTYGLIESGPQGWSAPSVLVPLSVALASTIVFILVELRVAKPMLPVSLLRSRAFSVTNVASFVLGFGTSAAFFLLSLFLQQVQGHSALSVGMRFIPWTLAVLLTAPIAGRLAAQYGPHRVMVGGYTVSAAGLFALVLLDAGTGTATVSAIFVVLGVGMGLSIGTTGLAGLAAVPLARSGLASATVAASRQGGTAVGVALLGAIITSYAGDMVSDPGYRDGFVHGLHWAAGIAAIATIVAVPLLLTVIRQQVSGTDRDSASALRGRP